MFVHNETYLKKIKKSTLSRMHQTLFLVVFCIGGAYAQDHLSDSLKHLLTLDTLSNTTRVDTYLALEDLYHGDSAQAFSYAYLAMGIAMANGYEEGIGDAISSLAYLLMDYEHTQAAFDTLRWGLSYAIDKKFFKTQGSLYYTLSYLHYLGGDSDKALSNAEKSYVCYEYERDTLHMGWCNNLIAGIYSTKYEMLASTKHYLKALDYATKTNDVESIIGIKANLGSIYLDIKDYEKASIYFDELDEEAMEDYVLLILQINKGDMSYDQGAYEKGRHFYEQALAIARKLAWPYDESSCLLGLGYYHYHVKDYGLAMHYFDSAYQIAEHIDAYELSAEALLEKGKVSMQNNQFILAHGHLTEAITLAKDLKLPATYAGCLEAFIDLYEKQGQHERALGYFRQFKEMSDSLYNDQKNKAIAQVLAEASFEQEKDSIFYVRQTEKQAYLAEVSANQSQLAATTVGLIIVCVLFIIILLINYSNQQRKQELAFLNQEITMQNVRLEKLNSTKTRFFSIVSHDIRSPMSMLFGYNQVLKYHIDKTYGKSDAMLEEMYEQLQQAYHGVSSLLDGLLKWALKEEGQMPYNPEQLSVSDSFNEMLEVLRLQASHKSIDLTYDLPSSLSVWVDKSSFLTIIRNLINNAIKFTDERGRVEVIARESDGEVEIKVIDNGIGIDPAMKATLFDINEKKVRKGTKGERGSGLGLNLVQEFVTMNRGTISLESEPGEGTTFVVRLPMQENGMFYS